MTGISANTEATAAPPHASFMPTQSTAATEGRTTRNVPVGLIVAALLMAAAPGCSMNTGHEFSAAAAEQIRSGVTDKAAVEKALGPPLRRSIGPNGDETWVYSFMAFSSSYSPAAFIPVVGPLLPNGNRATNDSQQLTITFTGDTVSSCKLVVGSYTGSGSVLSMGALVEAGGHAAGTTRETDCGDAPVARTSSPSR